MKERQRCDACKKKLFRVMLDEVQKATEIVCNNCGKIILRYKQNE